jgi:hypothetical protein
MFNLARFSRGAGFSRGAVGGAAVAIGLAMLALTHCTETLRDLGQGCLRDVDCVSGYCSGAICVAQPVLFDSAAPFDAGIDAGDAAADAHDAGPVVDVGVTHDTGMPPRDTGTTDGTADVQDGASDGSTHDAADSSPDVRTDAPAHVDAALHDARDDVMDATRKPG